MKKLIANIKNVIIKLAKKMSLGSAIRKVASALVKYIKNTPKVALLAEAAGVATTGISIVFLIKTIKNMIKADKIVKTSPAKKNNVKLDEEMSAVDRAMSIGKSSIDPKTGKVVRESVELKKDDALVAELVKRDSERKNKKGGRKSSIPSKITLMNQGMNEPMEIKFDSKFKRFENTKREPFDFDMNFDGSFDDMPEDEYKELQLHLAQEALSNGSNIYRRGGYDHPDLPIYGKKFPHVKFDYFNDPESDQLFKQWHEAKDRMMRRVENKLDDLEEEEKIERLMHEETERIFREEEPGKFYFSDFPIDQETIDDIEKLEEDFPEEVDELEREQAAAMRRNADLMTKIIEDAEKERDPNRYIREESEKIRDLYSETPEIVRALQDKIDYLYKKRDKVATTFRWSESSRQKELWDIDTAIKATEEALNIAKHPMMDNYSDREDFFKAAAQFSKVDKKREKRYRDAMKRRYDRLEREKARDYQLAKRAAERGMYRENEYWDDDFFSNKGKDSYELVEIWRDPTIVSPDKRHYGKPVIWC